MYQRLRTERLMLRPLDKSDLDSVHEYSSDPGNTMYMEFLPNDTAQETMSFLNDVTWEWEKDEQYYYEFAVVLNGELIGQAAVYLDEKKEVGDLSVILNRLYWRQGYGTEAAEAVKKFALEDLRLKKLVARCDYRNTAARHLAEKIGLTVESNDGMRVYLGNETAREITYAITA